MPPLGTKNLGLIKAIQVGVNPPLNTKILWYNDATTPYTTGPAKVHYYYDVITADWQPLASLGGTGTFTYIAFAEDCDGTGFTFEFDSEVHCYWSIITSVTEISLPALLPSLFADRWTKYCSCDTDGGGGNFTYIAYSDDCGESNFGTTLQYEVDCNLCEYADTYNVVSGGSGAFSISPTAGGINVVVTNAVAGNTVEIDLTLNSLPLNDLIDYCVEISTLPTYSGDIEIHIGDEPNKLNLNAAVSEWKNELQNNGSKLVFKIPDDYVGSVSTSFDIKVGTKECCAETDGEICYNCREYWAMITSPTEITPEDLTAEMFEGLWIKVPCECESSCDCDELFSLLSKQVESLNQNFNDYKTITNNRIQNLEQSNTNLQQQMDECCTALNGRVDELTTALNDAIEQLTNLIGETNTGVDTNTEEIEKINGKFEPEVFAESVKPTVTSELATFKKEVVDLEISNMTTYVDTKDENTRTLLEETTTPMNDNISTHRTELDDHETRIGELEKP